MKKRNLSAKKINHNFYLDKLKNPRIKKIYLNFKKELSDVINENYCVAISGGPDSMALAFLTKCLSLDTKKKYIFCHVDHRLRKSSKNEAKETKKKLKEFAINLNVLKWIGSKKSSNIQEQARLKRYELLFKKSKRYKINKILTAHHKGDLYENFIMRLLRGSGLKGLISFKNKFSKINKYEKFIILRPLLKFSKNDLKYIAENTFGSYINDPSNNDSNFLRVYIRKILESIKLKEKNIRNIDLSFTNLERSNEAIEFYVNKNLKENVIVKNKNKIILNKTFFDQPEEIVFRSLSSTLNTFSNKLKLTRGSKIANLIKTYDSSEKFYKITLSGCVFEKVSNSLIISREI
tara:strand:- start:714 stop:1760 length:1047 start_codon:yes stop_codon:yes gene_type:complete